MKTHFKTIALFLFLLITNACSSDSPEPKDDDPKQPPKAVVQEDIAEINDQVTAFMTKYDIPGASLAISKNGKLVYQKPFGLADKAANKPVTVDSQFRLGSLSKAYTGVAVMKLIQEGKFKLDDTVFGEQGLLGTTYGTKPYPENFKKVTVRHLLQMTSGGFVTTTTNADPIAMQQALDQGAYFSWMMDNTKLAFEPGTDYRYVNTNFFIAGRIIEKFSGKSYINYLKEDILKNIGDSSTEVGRIGKNGAFPNEVTYYGQGGVAGFEYNFSLERYDATGGLVATAKDVLRFVNAIDGFSTRPDVINKSSLDVFVTPSKANQNFACGIGIFGDIWYSYGSIPGTRTGFMRNSNGISAVILLNGTKDYFNAAEFDPFAFAMQDILFEVVGNNTRLYKDIDQF